MHTVTVILALIVGFLLGVLLMILLFAGREEEALVDRVEEAERTRSGAPESRERLREPNEENSTTRPPHVR